jgi:hypothetical protein
MCANRGAAGCGGLGRVTRPADLQLAQGELLY